MTQTIIQIDLETTVEATVDALLRDMETPDIIAAVANGIRRQAADLLHKQTRDQRFCEADILADYAENVLVERLQDMRANVSWTI